MRLRHYLFALVDAGGNVTPELHAVQRLIERRHAVTVLADDSVAPEVRSMGCTRISAPFQVLSRNGRAPLRQERGWEDTVAIEDGEEVDVIIRWSGYTGRYLLHCHNFEHEDHSVMARVDIV